MTQPNLSEVDAYLLSLQDTIRADLEAADGGAEFDSRVLDGERGGSARPRVLSEGAVIERAAVNFSHTVGAQMPAAATNRRFDLEGRSFEVVSLSLIIHPRNPYAPTTHANFRCFGAVAKGADPAWWFGGGYDLTSIDGFVEDAVHWHRTAAEACRPFGENVYPAMKAACDDYFFLPHRHEPRGIGGLFFDDLSAWGFERCFEFVRRVANSFLPAYLPILERRMDLPYGERQRAFQLYRRGRYVEFNLAFDRGTRFGLQAGGRAESILGSLPPRAEWRYDWKPEPGSPEERLSTVFLRPRDWLQSNPADESGDS